MGGGDEEKRRLLQEDAVFAESGEVTRDDGTMKEKKTRGLKRSVVVMGACFTAVAVTTLLMVTTMHGLCGQQQQQHHHHHHHEGGQPMHHLLGALMPSSRLAEPSGASAITVDDGRYGHVAVALAAAAEEEQDSGSSPDVELLQRAERKAGTPNVRSWQSATASANATTTTSTTTSSATAAKTVLVDFQVHQPVLTPDGATLDSGKSNGEAGDVQDSCQVLLMDHVFAYSYGEPYIGAYEPPSCEFNRVVMNFTVVSEGRQFDRLALMYFNDTEIWRTSTAEPTTAPGIRWTYLKDMTEYLALWNAPQKIIFDLGNLITDVYTGDFNTTLTATFFLDDDVDVSTAKPADLVIPISKRLSASDEVSQFTLPADNATNTISFPRNANRAVFSVSANGQSNEEFWWSNVLESDVDAFAATAGTFPGYSPWREVQVYIDDQLAGVQWPFPVVFTGGVVPSLHRPIVGPDAFDLKEHEIDITPWLGVLSDGNDHTFTIYVAGLLDNGGTEATVTQTVGSSWYVTGKIFVWLDDDEDSITTGTAPTIEAAAPSITVSQSLTKNANGTVNETLTYDTEVSRSYTVSAQVVSKNSSGTVSWAQSLTYSNKAYVWAEGYSQINDFLISGNDEATTSSVSAIGANYKTEYKYPLWCNTSYSYSEEGNLTIYGELIQGVQVYVEGAAVFPDGLEAFSVDGNSYTGSLVKTTKDSVAYFFEYADNSSSSGYGSADQKFSFGGFTGASGGSLDATPDEQLYYRYVEAVNSTVASDLQVLSGSSNEASSTSGGSKLSANSKNSYAQIPYDGGHGGPRLFMNRQGVLDGL